MVNPTPATESIQQLLSHITDPEIPVLTLMDMGVIRDIRHAADGTLEVVITPTYSGCPAMNMIATEIKATLYLNGYPNARIVTVLSPAWTTDWLTDEAKDKLRAYGIAPPQHAANIGALKLFAAAPHVACPQCGSTNTKQVSEFGSTACKAFYKCQSCLEPFDYFKCI